QVKDVMEHPVVTVEEDTPTAQVAETMLNKRIHRLPVMRGQELVGIITRHDLLKLIASGGESIPGNGS
ncbi:MAG: CBS domain-containing protein, partial [Chloroflexota bacterium]